MAYCQNCGTELNTNANFCPNCGMSVNGTAAQQNTATGSDTARTVITAAGTVAGVSILGNLLRRFRRHRFMPPPMGRPRRGPGPFGGPGRGHGPMGGPGGPGGHGPGGHGPMGGPGGGPGGPHGR